MAGPWERYGAAQPAGPWARYGGQSAESQIAAPQPEADNGILATLGRAGQFATNSVNRIAGGIGTVGAVASEAIGAPQGLTDWFRGEAKFGRDRGNRPVEGAASWENVKADPFSAETARFIVEQGLGGLPDMAGAVVAPWTYFASRAGDLGQTRAENNGQAQAGVGDVIAAAPGAAASVALERLGARATGILGGQVGGSVARRLGVGVAGEGLTEGAQEIGDYTTETLGTLKPWNLYEAADRGLQGAVIGAPMGGAMSAGSAAVHGMRANAPEPGPSPDAAPPSVRDQLTPEEADALTLHGVDVDGLTDVAMAKKAAERLIVRQPKPVEAPPVIATPHGNIAPNADEQGRAPETRQANAGDARRQFEGRVGGVESGNRDDAKNPRSSASGRYQFTDDTFVRQYQARFGTKESRESILAKKNDRNLQSVLMRDLTDANEAHLRQNGIPLTSGAYYLAHFAGPAGAVKLHKNPDAPVERILGQKVVDANPFLAGMKGRDVIGWADGKMGGTVSMAPFPAGHAEEAFGPHHSKWGDFESDTYRAPDHSRPEGEGDGYDFDPASQPGRMGDRGKADTYGMGNAENMAARQSKTAEELRQAGARGDGMATGDMGRPFKADPNTGEFEDVQRERVKSAEAEREKRWEKRREEAERLKAEFEARRNRAGQSDASSRYQKFGSTPHYDADTGFHRTTEDGFVADVDGNPVVWPSQAAAAKWAARFKMGGDFELQAHGTSKRGGDQPVTLQRKPGSTYGQTSEQPGVQPEASAPAQLAGPWSKFQSNPAPAAPANSEGGDTTASVEGDDRRARVATKIDAARPADPGKEPPKPRNFMGAVAEHLAERTSKAGMNVRISAEDAIDKGVPAEMIYHNPNAKYPTVKAGAAKVFTSTKAPLKSRARPVKAISLDDLGDRFDPTMFGREAGDGVQSHRMAPEVAGDLLRQSFEKDPAARDPSDPRFEAHADWEARMDELEEFERRFGDDLATMSDEELEEIEAQLDGAFGKLHDEVLHAADTGATIDPGDPDFWNDPGYQAAVEEDYGRQDARETDEPEAESRGREDTGDARRDRGEQAERAPRPSSGQGVEFSRQFDAFGEREGDQRRALERKGDEPLRGKKPQKAPGSDGGLFDDDGHGERQGTLLDGADTSMFREVPRAKLPREIIKDGMEVDRALNWVRENSNDGFHRDLADRLLDLNDGVVLRVYDSTKLKRNGDPLNEGLREAHGAVTHHDGQAVLFLNESKYGHGMSEETLLHEAIHAAIAIRIGSLRDNVKVSDIEGARGFGQDVRRIQILQRYVWDQAQKMDRNRGFSRAAFTAGTINEIQIAAQNPDEFLTYALTSKEFQRFLQGIRMPENIAAETSRLTVWQQLVNILRRVIGLDAKYQAQFEKILDGGNALDAVGEMANDLLDRLDDTPAVKQDRAAGNRLARQGGVSELSRNFKAMLDDDSGSLNLDRVAKLFVDLDTVSDAKDAVKRLGQTLRGSSATELIAKTLDKGRMGGRFVASYYHTIDARMRGMATRFNSPTMRELADMFHARAGRADGTSRTYHEAVEFHARRWNKQLFEALEAFAGNADAMTRIRNIITNTGTGSADEKAAARTVAKLLKEIHDYRLDAGENIGNVNDGYFPRVLDPDVVAANGAEFKTKAEALFIKGGDKPADAKAKADLWFHQVVNEHAGLDGAILDVRRAKAPGTTSGLKRSLDKDADAVLAKFYQKDALDVLAAYITGSAKRAEFTRRFGVPGRDGSAERTAWIAQHGHKDQLDVINDKIDAEMLASGKHPGDAKDLINSILEANLGILGKASTSFRLGISVAHGYNQIAKMDHSLITSFNELAMGTVRSGSIGEGLKFLGNSVHEFIRGVAKLPPTEARRYAEHLGIILNANMDQVLQSRISAVESTRGVNKLISRFYRVIGLHQFTEGTRIAAAKMAREHLNVLAGDLSSSDARTARRAERALAELGITDHAAFANFIAARAGKVRFAEIDGDNGMAATWTTAVNRMTNQTVMNPTRAVKPLWANHPLGSLLYGLMSYTFAFKKNVLDRAGAMAGRAVTERDPVLLAPLLIGLPILAAFTYINDTYVRPTLFGSTYDYANETTPVAMLRTADRASLLGALSPVSNVIFGTKYNRSLTEAFTGSFVGSGLQGVEKIAIKPAQAAMKGTETNGAARGSAGALYDLVVEPLMDGAMVGTVGGKLATGVVYASGSRPGSIFPSDREAFVEAMAGPEEKKATDPFASDAFDKAFKGASGDEFDKAFKKASGG
jgi:hypothetical protein